MTAKRVQVTGQVLRAMLHAGMLWVGKHREQLNRQNVYPVPDGDTGTNLWLTLKAAWRQADALEAEAPASRLWRAAAQGALEGSRGNSGVILSQFMRGVGEALGDSPTLTASQLPSALARGQQRAYAAVADPQEGTMLTVARDMQEAAQALSADASWETMLQHLQQEAQASVARTPDLLPVLRQAGVVDAGGWGLALFWEGLGKGLRGDAIALDPEAETDEAASGPTLSFAQIPERVHGFDVQFLSHRPQLSVDAMRAAVTDWGAHALVEGDADLVKVHVHVQDPGPVLSWACATGFITDVVVENMDAMAARRAAQAADAPRVPPAEGAVRLLSAAAADAGAAVAVVSSPGFGALFASLGANCLIECPRTINPSVDQFKEAIALAGGCRTVLVPNSANALAAARQAQAALPARSVAVIRTPSILNGVTAMYGFESAADWRSVVPNMQAQADRIVYGSVAQATRDLTLEGKRVPAGAFLALRRCRDPIASAAAPQAAAGQLVAHYLAPEALGRASEEYSLVTIYQGAHASAGARQAVEAVVVRGLPAFDVEWVETRQPHHLFMFVVE